MIKTIVSRFTFFKEDIKDYLFIKKHPSTEVIPFTILFTGVPRSGTTWFGDMFNVKGNLVYHEPFIPYTNLWGDKKDAEGADMEQLSDLYTEIKEGKSWTKYQKHIYATRKFLYSYFLHRTLPSRSNNIIIKDPGICYITSKLKQLEQIKIFYIFRHPLSVVSSLKRLNWDTTHRLSLMLRTPCVTEKLNETELYLLRQHVNFNPIQNMALHTAVLHKIMLLDSEENERLVYEEFAERPAFMFENLFSNLGLKYTEETKSYHEKLTQGSENINPLNRHNTERNSSVYKEIYKQRLSSDEINMIMSIYSGFKIPFYN